MLLQTHLRPNGEHIEIDESSFSGQRQVDMIYYQKNFTMTHVLTSMKADQITKQNS